MVPEEVVRVYWRRLHPSLFTSVIAASIINQWEQLACIMNTQEDADDRYNRLMDYLDAAEEIRVSKKELRADASPNRLNRSPGRNYVINVSTPPSKNNREMQSPNSGKNSNSGSKTTSGTKRYVWDEVDELDNNEWTSNSPSSSLPPPPSYRSSSSNNMNSPPAGRYSPSRLHHHVSSSSPTKDRSFVSNSDVASVSSPLALSETVDSLRRKIEAMKDELKERNGEIRDVQAELVRLGAARDRRTQKYQSHWEDKLRNLTDEQGKIVKRNLELLSRLRDDVKQLEAKEVALENKLASSRSNAESSIEVSSVTAQRRREKAKRQVESEERLMLEKVAVTKLESMKTQAAKLLGAKLDALVIRGKETVSVRTEELDAKFMSLKLQLQAELDTKFSESVGMLRAEQQDTTDKQRHQLERQLEEVKRRHQTELGSLQERLIRTRKALEEKCERGLSIDAEAALENLRAVRAAEAKQVTELTERHQRDLSALLRSHADEKATFEKQRKEDTEKWRQQRQSELKEHIERMRQRKRDIHAAKAAADTERIVSRLRSEADTERRRLVSSKETELESIREHAQEQLDSLRDAERRLVMNRPYMHAFFS